MFYALYYMPPVLHRLLEFVGFVKLGHESFSRYQQYARQLYILPCWFVGLGRGC